MKRYIRNNSGRPIPTHNSKWQVKKIIVTIYVEDNGHIVASSTSVQKALDSLFTTFVDHLIAADYLPYLSLDVMKRKFHSPKSESEYYTFLKVDNNEKIKLILDVRFADHPQIQHGKLNPRDNHLRFMEANKAKVSEDLGFDVSEAKVDFIDTVVEDKGFIEIDIDNYQTFNLQDAIKAFDKKVSKLP